MKIPLSTEWTLIGLIFCVELAHSTENLAATSATQTTAQSTVSSSGQFIGDSLFLEIHDVATHPRCANCHNDLRPRQLDSGRLHKMYIHSKIKELGSSCQSCHQNQNFTKKYMPPGAPKWNMPAVWLLHCSS